MIKKLKAGDRQISARSWNEMRQFINDFSAGQNTYSEGVTNPFLVKLKNATGYNLPVFGVVKINTATYQNRSDTEFKNQGAAHCVEMNGVVPDSNTCNIAIVQKATPNGSFSDAIGSGCTPCFVYIPDNSTYSYARPVVNNYLYLEATNDVTGVTILWHKTGSAGIKPAYVRIDSSGGSIPLVAATNPNSDARPEGAWQLNTTRTYLHAVGVNNFGDKSEQNPPAICNPCGFPPDRPVIISKCTGFPDYSTTPSSSDVTCDYVAIGADCRDLFVINKGNHSQTAGTGTAGIYKKGALFYVTNSGGSWIPANYCTNRLAVCQRDMPSGNNKEFLMPYWTPETNIGVTPNRSSSNSFVERCGVASNEHEFSNKRLDYHYSNGRYSYEPRFIFIGNAKSYGGGVGLEIEGNDYSVTFPTQRSLTSWPDVYYNDQITVEVDATGDTPILTAIEYPMDFKEGTIIASYTNLATISRGWEDVTNEKYSSDCGDSDFLVLYKNPYSEMVTTGLSFADYRIHERPCPCQDANNNNNMIGSSGAGNACEHTSIEAAQASFKWYKKKKDNAII